MSEQKNYIETQFANSQVYRNNLAQKIKEEPDKEKRKNILANEKMSHDYAMAYTIHNDKKFDEQMSDSLKEICKKANSYDELIKLIEENKDLQIVNDNWGLDRIEHIIKRLKMARELRDLNLIPTDGGLKDRATSLLLNENFDFNLESGEGSYRRFLRDNFLDLELNDQDLENIRTKLPAEVFASIDIKMENIILILNSFDKTKTEFSCSGHFENDFDLDKIDRMSLSLVLYLSINSSNQELIDLIKNFKGESYGLKIQIEDIGAGSSNIVLTIKFDKAPEDWILKNNNRRDEEIIEKSKKLLEEYFNTKIYSNNEKDLYEEVMTLQRKLLSSDLSKANLSLKHNSGFLLEVTRLLPNYLRKKEYKNYFDNNVDEIVKKRDEFIKELELLLIQFRNQQRA